MAAVSTLMRLEAVRAAVAAILEPGVGDIECYVHGGPVDGVSPPAIVLQWGDPWLTAGAGTQTLRAVAGGCVYTARLEVICVGSRVDPVEGFAVCEQLAGYVIDRMQADAYTFPVQSTTAPRGWRVGDVPCIAASVIYAIPIAI